MSDKDPEESDYEEFSDDSSSSSSDEEPNDEKEETEGEEDDEVDENDDGDTEVSFLSEDEKSSESDDSEDEEEEEQDEDDDDNNKKMNTISLALDRSEDFQMSRNLSREDDDDDSDDDDDDENYLKKFSKEASKNFIQSIHPEMAIHNHDEVALLSKVVRNKDGQIIDELHKTLPFLTKYERARVLGQRSKQIENGSKPFINVPENIVDAYTIAEMELKQKRIPFTIRRPIPGGKFEYWPLKELDLLCY
jgi:DNA-directed RNA polymerase subunit K/omega